MCEIAMYLVSYRTGFGWSLSGEMSSTAAKSALVRSAPLQHLFTLHFILRAFRHLVISMGLPMDDIHTPTVPSGPATGQRAANGVAKDKMSLMDLIAEKTRVEEELTALGSVLDSVCNGSWGFLLKRPAAD